jgi:hypothetical protein
VRASSFFVTANTLGQSTSNAYTVSKLPALPDRIRADAIGEYSGFMYGLCR